MANPNSITPLMVRIEEIFVSGSGQINPIASGSYSLDWYYDGRTPEELSHDTLNTPQINWVLTYKESDGNWYKPSPCNLYDVDLEVQVARHMNAKTQKALRFAAKSAFNNDFKKITEALTSPGNLDNTIAGDETGLCSGMFEEATQEKPTIDFQNQVIYGNFTYKGFVVLATGSN